MPHPTPEHPIHGCYVSCRDGYFMRGNHSCRTDARRFLDITITAEEDRPGDPEESRWFTGIPSYGAEYIVRERLAAEGTFPPCPASPSGQLGGKTCALPLVWAQRYSATMKEVQREMGDEARAAYNKQDVELTTCRSYIDRICAGIDKKCGTYPGEDQMGNSLPHPP